MNLDYKVKWVEALRSGVYRQAVGTLRDKDGSMCCLGVLLDVSKIGAWADGHIYNAEVDGAPVSSEGDLCELRGEFGISRDQQAKLIHMNDGEHEFKGMPQSFAEIANYIEQQF